MILAAEVGQDEVVPAAEAQILLLGIILHARTLPLQVHAQRAAGGVIHHMQLQVDIALLEALHRVQHAHAGIVQHDACAQHGFGENRHGHPSQS